MEPEAVSQPEYQQLRSEDAQALAAIAQKTGAIRSKCLV